MASAAVFDLIENYIYIYQLEKYVIIPVYPETISDSLGSTFNSTNALSRTAPIQSYVYSGPRKVQITLNLHRDFMSQVNYSNTNFLNKDELNDDYVDTLIKYLQAMALPVYTASQFASSSATKVVNPPIVAVRFGNTCFIKGVVNGDVGVTYSGAIDANNKYQQVAVSFNIYEIDPQDANSIVKYGSMRSLEVALTKGLYS